MNGVGGAVDVDTFNGSSSALRAITMRGLFVPEDGPTMDPAGDITFSTPNQGQYGATMGQPWPEQP